MSNNDRSELQLLRDENELIKNQQKVTEQQVIKLQNQVASIEKVMTQVLKDLTSHDERHATILGELNGLKESVMDSNSLNITKDPMVSSMRSIPAPSKVLVNDQKKKDNRLFELRRITRECMHVEDEEAGLRLYKLQKTMVHVVSNLKNFMKDKNEDVCKSWKSIDISTQRIAFEMVEREAVSLGVPLNLCIGYWGARRLISKSWANALRTTKKHVKSGGIFTHIIHFFSFTKIPLL